MICKHCGTRVVSIDGEVIEPVASRDGNVKLTNDGPLVLTGKDLERERKAGRNLFHLHECQEPA